MNWWLMIIPFAAALIGWLINSSLIKLLFHPVRPIKILGFTFQGIIPKKQKSFAKQLGKYVSEELFSFSAIEEKLSHPENIEKILPFVEAEVDTFLRKKLIEQMPMIGMFIGDKTILQFKNIFMQELAILFPKLISEYAQNLKADLNFEEIISQKLSSIDFIEFEKKMLKQFRREIILFKAAGAFTGIIIGFLQLFILLLLR
ncbi:hypothetical protein GALL_167990 [mine drainage metagenome]|uniref:DUF445 domain-containing protein n=1 Tax=mine drainage metagenome TaxID=410659 RepID=A0A1J5SM85_9ZZZZ